MKRRAFCMTKKMAQINCELICWIWRRPQRWSACLSTRIEPLLPLFAHATRPEALIALATSSSSFVLVAPPPEEGHRNTCDSADIE